MLQPELDTSEQPVSLFRLCYWMVHVRISDLGYLVQ